MSRVPSRWRTIADIAATAEVSRNAVWYWIRANARPGLDYRVVDRVGYVRPEVAEAYLMRRGVPSGRPGPGYLPALELARRLGVSHNTVLGYCYRGEVPCTRWRRTIYVARYELERRVRSPLPDGWVWLEDAARELGMTRPALRKRLARRGVEIRTIGGRGAVRRYDVAEVREIVPAGAVPAQRLARELGVSRGAVTAWARAHRRPVYYGTRGGHRIAYVDAETAEAYRRHRGVRRVA